MSSDNDVDDIFGDAHESDTATALPDPAHHTTEDSDVAASGLYLEDVETETKKKRFGRNKEPKAVVASSGPDVHETVAPIERQRTSPARHDPASTWQSSQGLDDWAADEVIDTPGTGSNLIKKIIPAALGAALVVGAGIGAWTLIPDDKQENPVPTSAAPTKDPSSILSKKWPGDGPATFAPVALSTMVVPDTAVVAPTEHGLVVINDKKLAVYESGTRISAIMGVPETINFVLPTKVNGRDLLVWRAGNVLYFWSPQSPMSQPTEQRIGKTATVSSAGTSILISQGEDTFTTDTKNFTKVSKPTRAAAAIPMASDGEGVIAGDPNGSLWQINDTEAEAIKLQSPAPGAKPAKWVSAGHGLAISLWRKSGDPKVVVAVHSTKDGSLMSATPVDQAAVSEEQWIRGQNFNLAAFGPLEFDMETGELLFDGTKDGVSFTRPLGTVAAGVSDQGNVVVADTGAGNIAWSGGQQIIGVDAEGNAIVRSDDSKTISFHAPNG